MSTCYFFVHHWRDDQCLSVRLDSTGQVEQPLALRTVDELRSLQHEARTIIVLCALTSGLYRVDLPNMNARKARTVIPFALEDDIAQPINTCHCAFDVTQYHQHHYLVVVTDHALLENLMMRLREQALAFDAMTLDWFALNPDESCVHEAVLLVHDASYQGALSVELASIYLDQAPSSTERLVFQDSAALNHFTPTKTEEVAGALWIAQRLQTKAFINLCQGPFTCSSRAAPSLRPWYLSAAGMFLAMVLVAVVFRVLSWSALNQQEARMELAMNQVYQTYFPHETMGAQPRVRINQWVRQQGSPPESTLWNFLQILHGVMVPDLQIEHLSYVSHRLQIKLSASDFASLEAVEKKLKQTHPSMIQTEAKAQGERVVATWEIF